MSEAATPESTAPVPRGSPAAQTQPAEFPAIPGYELLRTLGVGGAGTVYEARAQDELGRRFAIKVFPAARRREYERELETLRAIEDARAAADSQDLVETIAAGETPDGLAHVVMAYAPGGDLRARVSAQGPLSADDAVAVLIPVLRGLSLLHDHGLVHKDVKPANVLLDLRDRARLGDFGLTRVLDGAPLSSAGTPGFCAPELITGRGAEAGVQVDVYSAAATLYFLLTGAAPLPGRPDLFLLERRRIDRPLQDVLFRALALEPSQRPSTAAAFQAELEAWQQGLLVSLPWWEGLQASSLKLGALALGLLLLVAVTARPTEPNYGPDSVRISEPRMRPVSAAASGAESAPGASGPVSSSGAPSEGSPPFAQSGGAAADAKVKGSPPAEGSRAVHSEPPPNGVGGQNTPLSEAGAPSPPPSPVGGPGPQPRWDGYELTFGGPTWDAGTVRLPDGSTRVVFDDAPLARARHPGGAFAAAGPGGAVRAFSADGAPLFELPAVAEDPFPSLALDATHLLRVLAFPDTEAADRLELYALSGDRLAIWDGAPVATAAALLPADQGFPRAALGTPDGRLLIVDLAAGEVALELKLDADEILALTYDPTRRWLLALADARDPDALEPQLELLVFGLDTLTRAGQPRAVIPLPQRGAVQLPD